MAEGDISNFTGGYDVDGSKQELPQIHETCTNKLPGLGIMETKVKQDIEKNNRMAHSAAATLIEHLL